MRSEQQPPVDELAEDLATAIKVHATSEGFETVASTVGHSLLAPLKAIVAGVKKGWGPEHDYKDGLGESWGKFKHEFKHVLDNLKEDVSRSGVRQRMDDANKFHEILKGLTKEEAEIIAPMIDRALTNIQKNSLTMITKGMVSGGLAITGTSHLWHGLRAAVTHIITDWTADLALKTAHTKIRGVDSENAKENRQENIEDDEELAKLEEIQKKLTAAFNTEYYEGSELLIILSNAGLIGPIKEETKDQIHGSSSPKTESKFRIFAQRAKEKLKGIVGEPATEDKNLLSPYVTKKNAKKAKESQTECEAIISLLSTADKGIGINPDMTNSRIDVLELLNTIKIFQQAIDSSDFTNLDESYEIVENYKFIHRDDLIKETERNQTKPANSKISGAYRGR